MPLFSNQLQNDLHPRTSPRIAFCKHFKRYSAFYLVSTVFLHIIIYRIAQDFNFSMCAKRRLHDDRLRSRPVLLVWSRLVLLIWSHPVLLIWSRPVLLIWNGAGCKILYWSTKIILLLFHVFLEMHIA